MGDKPAIRAAMTRDFLASLSDVEPGLAGAVIAEVPPEVCGQLDGIVGIGWIDLENHSALNEAARKVAGERGFREAWRLAMLRTFRQPILKPMVEGGVHVFGLNPGTFIKLAPRAWGLVSRDLGTLTVDGLDASKKSGRLVMKDFPLDLSKSGTFFRGMVGVFEAFFEATRSSGTVILVEEELTTGTAVYDFSWS